MTRSSFRARSTASFAAGCLAFAFALHCGSTDESLFTDGPCANELSGQCGTACAETTECGAGLYCGTRNGNKVCLADCTSSTPCMGGAACSPSGQCVGGQFGDTEGGVLEGGGCPGGDVKLKGLDPTVLLLIDQSGSMNYKFPGPEENGDPNRWTVLRNAILDPTNGIIKKYEGQVSFGLALYTWDRKSRAACPQVASVNFAFGNYSAINAVYSTAVPGDNTPTAESLRKAGGIDAAGAKIPGGFADTTTPGPKAIVLATDGDPDTCDAPDSNGTNPPKEATIKAVQDLFKVGIQTYVIASGSAIAEAHQKAVANAGVGLDISTGTAPYYRPSSQDELATAFNTIVYGQRSCKFALNGSVTAGGESTGKVTLNGSPLTLNDANGWRLNTPSEVEILGTSCETLLKSPSATLSAIFGCGSFIPIN